MTMDEKQAGVTALVTAYARAYHATHDSPKIFDDTLADALFTPEEHAFFNQSLASMLPQLDPALAATQPDPATALARVMQIMSGPTTLSRSRYCEDCLEDAIRQGVQQVVILGAGLDTFAFRRPDLADTLQVFEMDHPVTQALKRQRVEAAGWTIPRHLHFVPIDFTQEHPDEVLGQSSYQPQLLSFFSWLGVTYYLPSSSIFTTLATIARLAPSGSQIVFDYIDGDALNPEKASSPSSFMHSVVRQCGEPMKTSLDPQTLGAEMESIGFQLEENLAPQEIESRYFQGRTDLYHAPDHLHFARLKVI
jgi:methyltransferase (TIGR00027 family)